MKKRAVAFQVEEMPRARAERSRTAWLVLEQLCTARIRSVSTTAVDRPAHNGAVSVCANKIPQTGAYTTEICVSQF